jgi:sugar phosphate isomerase/epimerase
MTPFSRRRFLQLTASSMFVAPLARALEPFQRGGSPRFQLSLAAYSFREFFKEQRGKLNPAGKLDMLAFVDYCADQGWPGAELTSYFFPSALTEEYLLQVRRQAFLRGVEITGTSVGNNFALPNGPERDAQIADVKKWIDHAAVLGAPHIRVFAGAAKGIDPAESRKLCIGALEECAEYAGKKGIFLGLENHGGIVSRPEELLDIVRTVKSRWLGVNLDTGNFHGADPYADLAQCAPYAVNVQVKVEIKPEGAKTPQHADLARFAKILRDANYQGWVVLEYEAKEDPWKAVPPLLVKMREVFGVSAAPTTAAADWQPLFDGKTLDGWKAPDFSGQGEVTVKDGQMILGIGDDLTGMNYVGDLPKNNYEVSLEASRQQGSDFFCGLTLPYGDKGCTLILGGWGGALVGISSINGDDASENETTKFLKFEQGKWYRVRAKMTPDRIGVWIDDEQVVDLETTGKTIDMRAGEIELSRPFGIATFRTQGAVRNLKLRRLAGAQ